MSQNFRAKAAEYRELVKGTDVPGAVREFQKLERSFTELASNEDWLANNYDKTVHPRDKDVDGYSPALPEKEEHILSLGAAPAMTADAINPLQILFPRPATNALISYEGDMDNGQIARFLHNHKNKQQKSDFTPGQYPGYLTPDGTWRFGENAKTIADAAWANHDRPSASKPCPLSDHWAWHRYRSRQFGSIRRTPVWMQFVSFFRDLLRQNTSPARAQRSASARIPL